MGGLDSLILFGAIRCTKIHHLVIFPIILVIMACYHLDVVTKVTCSRRIWEFGIIITLKSFESWHSSPILTTIFFVPPNFPRWQYHFIWLGWLNLELLKLLVPRFATLMSHYQCHWWHQHLPSWFLARELGIKGHGKLFLTWHYVGCIKWDDNLFKI